MPDWNEPAPNQPPGATQPKPGPQDPGWAEWLRGVARDGAQQATGSSESTEYSVGLTVERGESKLFPLSGGTPEPWIKEDVTYETVPPAEYKDFTRYKRKYPRIVVQYFCRITVRVVITFPGGATYQRQFEFWEPVGAPITENNRWTYRWRRTSGLDEEKGGKWYDGTIPDHWNGGVKPYEDDLKEPINRPPDWLLSFEPNKYKIGTGWGLGGGTYGRLGLGYSWEWMPRYELTPDVPLIDAKELHSGNKSGSDPKKKGAGR